jgi:hypothetical protein
MISSISGTHEAMSQAKYEIEKLLQNHAAGVVNSVGTGVTYGNAPAPYGQQQHQHAQQFGQQQQQIQQQTYGQQPQYDQHQPHHQVPQQQQHQQQTHSQYGQQQYSQHQAYGQQQPHMQQPYGQLPALASALPTNTYPTYADPGPVGEIPEKFISMLQLINTVRFISYIYSSFLFVSLTCSCLTYLSYSTNM